MTKISTAVPDIENLPVPHVYIGDVDFGPSLLKMQIHAQISKTPTANVVLRKEAAATDPMDFFGPVRISVEVHGSEHGQFAGIIERTFSGTLDGQEVIRLECGGLHKLREKSAGPFLRANITASESIWTLTRTAGYPESMLDIDGLDGIEIDTVEVAIPLFGVTLDEEFNIGRCLVTNAAGVAWATEGWTDEHLVDAFRKAPSYVVIRMQEKLLFNAERAAIHDAEVIAGWLAVRLRYGAALMPNGSAPAFNRAGGLCVPHIGPVTAARGVVSGRRWLRLPRTAPGRYHVNLPTSLLADPAIDVGGSLRFADSEAMLAFQRSLTAADPLASVITLWDAINFYVAGTPVPPMFFTDDLKLIIDNIPEGPSAEKKKAAKEKVKRFNDPPLMARLDAALKRDRVPIHPSEMKLLRRLRDIRNPAQHGTVAPVPDEEDVVRAWSLVSRMLTYRAHRVAREKAGDPESR